jgi:hypothetical protein
LYRLLLETKYGLKVGEMCMVVGYPGQKEAVVYNHRVDNKVKLLLKNCVQATRARRFAHEAITEEGAGSDEGSDEGSDDCGNDCGNEQGKEHKGGLGPCASAETLELPRVDSDCESVPDPDPDRDIVPVSLPRRSVLGHMSQLSVVPIASQAATDRK